MAESRPVEDPTNREPNPLSAHCQPYRNHIVLGFPITVSSLSIKSSSLVSKPFCSFSPSVPTVRPCDYKVHVHKSVNFSSKWLEAGDFTSKPDQVRKSEGNWKTQVCWLPSLAWWGENLCTIPLTGTTHQNGIPLLWQLRKRERHLRNSMSLKLVLLAVCSIKHDYSRAQGWSIHGKESLLCRTDLNWRTSNASLQAVP